MDHKLWEKCAERHGHECGGLTIGFKAALYVMELMGLRRDENGCVGAEEKLICVAENMSCAVDAIREALGCTEERGTLLFHLTDNQSYTFFNCRTRESIRLVLKARPEGITREQSFAYYQGQRPCEMFERLPVMMAMPESGRKTVTYVCSACGESGGMDWIRFVDGKPLCMDCIAEMN